MHTPTASVHRDHCDGWGACTHTVAGGWCLIGGRCVRRGKAGRRAAAATLRRAARVGSLNTDGLRRRNACADDQCNAAGCRHRLPASRACQTGVACDGAGLHLRQQSGGRLAATERLGDVCNGGRVRSTAYACTPGTLIRAPRATRAAAYVRKGRAPPATTNAMQLWRRVQQQRHVHRRHSPAPSDRVPDVGLLRRRGRLRHREQNAGVHERRVVSPTTPVTERAVRTPSRPAIASSAGSAMPQGCPIVERLPGRDPTANTVAWTTLGSGDACDSDPCTAATSALRGMRRDRLLLPGGDRVPGIGL